MCFSGKLLEGTMFIKLFGIRTNERNSSVERRLRMGTVPMPLHLVSWQGRAESPSWQGRAESPWLGPSLPGLQYPCCSVHRCWCQPCRTWWLTCGKPNNTQNAPVSWLGCWHDEVIMFIQVHSIENVVICWSTCSSAVHSLTLIWAHIKLFSTLYWCRTF